MVQLNRSPTLRCGVRAKHEMNPITNLLIEIGAYLKAHWVHGVLCLPAILTVTVVHELAHALAVLAQGGTRPRGQGHNM